MPGTDEFDVDPEEWRKQFWGDDANADDTAAKPKQKPNGADHWDAPDMGVLRLRRRPPPALPLEVFGETWEQWIIDAASAAGLPGRLCRCAIARQRLGADRQRAVGAGLAGMG
jgi:hypothetical protein